MIETSTAGTASKTNKKSTKSTRTTKTTSTSKNAEDAAPGQEIRFPPALKTNPSLDSLLPSPASTASSRFNDAIARARTSTHTPSPSISSGSITGSLPGRKSRYSEPGTSEIHAKLLNFVAHPVSPRSVESPWSVLPRSRCHSGGTLGSLWSDASVPVPEAEDPTQLNFGDVDDNNLDTPQLQSTVSSESISNSLLPESYLALRPSLISQSSRRDSGNSVSSSTTSVCGLSQPSGTKPTTESLSRLRSASLMSSSKSPSLPQSQSEAGLSNVTVTTSSTAQAGQALAGAHNLTTRDPHAQPLDLMKRTQRSDNTNANASVSATSNPSPIPNPSSSNSSNPRPQPDRSRSRAKRRFSGSTANSSHSPSSDRGPIHREKEEGR